MTLSRFLHSLSNETYTDQQLRSILGQKSVRSIVASPISLHVIGELGFTITERLNLTTNLMAINTMIENGDSYFLQHKKQSISDLIAYRGHNKNRVDPISSVRLSSSFI